MSCGVRRRHDLDSVLLWLWRRPAAAAPIGPQGWEPPYAAGKALKSKKKKCLQWLSLIITFLLMPPFSKYSLVSMYTYIMKKKLIF